VLPLRCLSTCARLLLIVVLSVLAIAPCAAQLDVSEVRLVRVGASYQAELVLDFQPSEAVLEALDASVPLVFELAQRTPDGVFTQAVTLSYAPLFERFELKMGEQITPFRLRTELLDAFSALRGVPVRLDAFALRLQLQIGKLPAPLRLPAVLDGDWYLDTGWIDLRANVEQVPNAPQNERGEPRR
jgi:hypothetical protein